MEIRLEWRGPYNARPDQDGFTPEFWWDVRDEWDLARPGLDLYYTGQIQGQEVFRALVCIANGQSPDLNYRDKIPGDAVEIRLFDVRQDARRLGIGAEAVGQLALRHPGRKLYAHAKDSIAFWEKSGFHRWENSSPTAEFPLFVLDPPSPAAAAHKEA